MTDAQSKKTEPVEGIPLAELVVRLMRPDPFSPAGIQREENLLSQNPIGVPVDVSSEPTTGSSERVNVEVATHFKKDATLNSTQPPTFQEEPKRPGETSPGPSVDFHA